MDLYGIFCVWDDGEECGNTLVGNIVYTSKELADQKRIVTYGDNDRFIIGKIDIRDK